MVTQFGKMLRILRMDKGELLKEMADRLEVSSPFLSMIELGEKNIPKGMVDKLFVTYDIAPAEFADWRRAAEDSIIQTKFNLQQASMIKRQAALVFSRNFNDMPDETAKKILKIFNARSDE